MAYLVLDGLAACGSGVGSQECTEDEIHALQTLDTTLPLDPLGKAIKNQLVSVTGSFFNMRTALNGTGHVSAPSSAALVVPSVHVLFVSSVESVNAQNKHVGSCC